MKRALRNLGGLSEAIHKELSFQYSRETADIYTLNLHGINEHFSFKYLFLFPRHHIPTKSVTPFSEYKPTLHPQFFQSL